MLNLYDGREQTKAKHFILKQYLQELAFKVLNIRDLTYVDGFSGPWEEQDSDFSDTSFKIAISVLKDAQTVLESRGIRRRIRCFFVEKDIKAFARLKPAVQAFHNPIGRFEVKSYCGTFEDAVPEIRDFIGISFSLIFIDPTGWTGYSLDRIRPLFASARCEVLINFMYDHVNRFIASDDPAIVTSFDAILGGPGWRDRLGNDLPKGRAVERLFRSTLKDTGGFEFVVSTKIDKSTADRPHFFIAYGTKSRDGLKAFREVEHKALRQHEQDRFAAKERQQEAKTGQTSFFSTSLAWTSNSLIEELVLEQIALAKVRLVNIVSEEAIPFVQLVPRLLQPFMLRETNVKDLCVALAKEGTIKNTWSPVNRKPVDSSLIRTS